MNDQLDLDQNQSHEAASTQSEAHPSDKQTWTRPSLAMIDINQETAASANTGNDNLSLS